MPVKDSLIAAAALANRLTVVTRTSQASGRRGSPVIDPFEA